MLETARIGNQAISKLTIIWYDIRLPRGLEKYQPSPQLRNRRVNKPAHPRTHQNAPVDVNPAGFSPIPKTKAKTDWSPNFGN